MNASSYAIQQSPYADFRSVGTFFTANNNYSFTSKPVGTYYYRVKGENTNVCQGNWSNEVSVVVKAVDRIAPGAPTGLTIW